LLETASSEENEVPIKLSIALSGIILLVVSTALSAQTVTLNGQLIAEDTRRPLPEVEITALSLTRPVSIIKTTTGADGWFSLKASRGVAYHLCSAANSRYAESCQFSKPLTVRASSDLVTVQIVAPAGIRMRVRIVDPDGLHRSPDGTFAAPDPALLYVFAQEEITRTRIPVKLEPSTALDAFEASVVIPISMRWDVAMSSERAKLFASDGSAYQFNTAIPRPKDSSDEEFLAVFTLRK
jgi:hypothetical protein